MVGASKILTVSYGTFSCTLEGFDDSFTTMKAIAEYFRDLAAEDRYFGAEPPAPDTEMLAKIAERSVNTQVDARISNGGVVLRPRESAPQTAPTAAISAPVESPMSQLTPEQPPVQPVEISGDSVAAKLQRIRAVVAQNKARAAAPIKAQSFFDDDEPADLIEDAEISENVPTFNPAPELRADINTGLRLEKGVEAASDEPETTESVADDVTAEEHPEDIAEDIAEDPAEEIVEERAEEPAEEIAEDIAEEPAEETAEETAEDHLVDQSTEAEQDSDQEEPSEFFADVDSGFEDDDDRQEENLNSDDEGAGRSSIASAALARARARVIKVKKTDLDDAIASGALQNVYHAEETSNDFSDEKAVADIADFEELSSGEPVDDNASAEEDLVEEDIAEDEQAEEDITENDVAEDDAPEEADDLSEEAEAEITQSAPEETSSLSEEDEAALVAELAEVELDNKPTVRPVRLVPGKTRKDVDTEVDADVSRLLEETNTQLESSESTRRRSAFAHLKAAVAATVADRKLLGGRKEKKDETNVYRDDLAKVVNPLASGTERKKSEPIAPLVLVSEQRIDIPKTAPIMPVQPRRVATGNLAVQEIEEFDPQIEPAADKKKAMILAENTSFSEFAESMGASELPDLLEAAAAYTAFIEGRPHFSRTQVMKQVAGFEPQTGYTREAGLRSFGQLLREGRFQKIQRNQFVISNDTKFKPEARYNKDEE